VTFIYDQNKHELIDHKKNIRVFELGEARDNKYKFMVDFGDYHLEFLAIVHLHKDLKHNSGAIEWSVNVIDIPETININQNELRELISGALKAYNPYGGVINIDKVDVTFTF
jgi:hypothetical protein